MMATRQSIESTFETHFQQLAEGVAIAPGRINLLGEHVDYNGGLALPCAINLGTRVAAATRGDQTCNFFTSDLEANCQFSLNDLDDKQTTGGEPMPVWARYLAGVAWSLQRAGCQLTGLNAVIQSEIPIGAGLSSSAALEIAVATAWLHLTEQHLEPLEIARLCQQAENEYVGVNSGLMDQWTITHGQKDHALLLDFAQKSSRKVKLPGSISLVIAFSGVRRSLSSSAYSQRVQECRHALEILQLSNPGLQHLGQASREQLKDHKHKLSSTLYQRGRHVISEVERVKRAVERLESGDSLSFGRLLLEGHASLRDDFQVSSEALDTLVELAIDIDGCLGARLTGAGFGGCTINWVEISKAEAFVGHLVNGYQSRMGRRIQVWRCQAVDGVRWRPLVN